MATLSYSRSITDPHLDRLAAALRARYGMPNATNAEIQVEWRNRVTANLIGIAKDYEREQAAKTAADGVAEISLT